MKKLISVSLTLIMMLLLCMPAFAAPDSITLSYDLSCNGSELQSGINEVIVHTGDIITVSYKLSASESASVSVTQNEIYYDHSFFALESGSNKTSAGYGDYMTSLQTRLDGRRYVYFNTLVTHNHTSTPAEIGTFELKVIAESGESTVASVNNMAFGAGAVHYGSASVALHVSIDNPQPQEFNVIYAADGGIVSPTEQTVDAGDAITLPTPTKQYNEFEYWSISGNSNKYYAGQTYTPTSDVTFTAVWAPVPAPAAPTGLVGIAASSATATDGKISGTTTAMEYSLNSSFDTAYGCSAGTTSDLKVGTYYLRIKADGNTPAGNYTAVVVSGASSGGGGDMSTQNIFINTPENGTATASSTNAAPESTVIITTTPNMGYECSGVIATDDDDNEIFVNEDGDGIYSFIMPEGIVMVTVSFDKTSGNNQGYKDCKKDQTCPMAEFTDLNITDWYHDGVHYCLENGLMEGVGNRQFNPNGTSTRAMIVTILYRMEGKPDFTGGNTYDDVENGRWYTDAVIWATDNGIVEGYGNGTFGPNNPITREQMATIMYRYAGYKGYDLSLTTDLSGYTDASETSDWALIAMRWANANELVSGLSDSILAPKNNAVRAQVATIIQRFCENIVQES